MPPQFSISVPIGAYHPLLRDCLASLAMQNPSPNVALLDASGDPRVAAVADEFDHLIKYRRHGPDAGQTDAIIEGWREVEGDILGWLNADDALYPGALQIAAAAFERDADLGVIYGHSVIVDDDFEVTGYHWAVAPPSEALLYGDIISQPSCFFRRSLCDEVGGLNRDLHYTMDWDLWVRFWRAGAKFEYTEEVLSRVLWTKDAKTGGFGRARRAELARIIDMNDDPIRGLKSRIGFGLHYLFEYLMPASLAKPLRRALAPSSAEKCGLGRNGEIAEVAIIQLTHYNAEPVRAVRATLESGAVRVDSDAQADVRSVDDGVELRLSTPLQPGKVFELSLKNDGQTPAMLRSVALLSAPHPR